MVMKTPLYSSKVEYKSPNFRAHGMNYGSLVINLTKLPISFYIYRHITKSTERKNLNERYVGHGGFFYLILICTRRISAVHWGPSLRNFYVCAWQGKAQIDAIFLSPKTTTCSRGHVDTLAPLQLPLPSPLTYLNIINTWNIPSTWQAWTILSNA